jgi:ribosomal protein S1
MEAPKILSTPLPLHKVYLILGTVANFKPKPYGVDVDLGDGLTGFLTVSLISNERVEYVESILQRDENIMVGL